MTRSSKTHGCFDDLRCFCVFTCYWDVLSSCQDMSSIVLPAPIFSTKNLPFGPQKSLIPWPELSLMSQIVAAFGCVWKCWLNPEQPNGFADHEIPFWKMASYHWEYENPTFSVTKAMWQIWHQRLKLLPSLSLANGTCTLKHSQVTSKQSMFEFAPILITLWWTYKKLLKMAIEIVDFPINSMVDLSMAKC